MKVLISGGTGFMGTHLIKSLTADNHQVWVLSRSLEKSVENAQIVVWNGKTTDGWGHIIDEMDAVVNLAGLSLYHWPWTKRKKQRFLDSRVEPGRALASAIYEARKSRTNLLRRGMISCHGLRLPGKLLPNR